MKISFKVFSLIAVLTLLITACASQAGGGTSLPTDGKVVEYGLETAMIDGQMAFIGVGGGIDGVHNPTLSAHVGDLVRVTLTAGDGVEHPQLAGSVTRHSPGGAGVGRRGRHRR